VSRTPTLTLVRVSRLWLIENPDSVTRKTFSPQVSFDNLNHITSILVNDVTYEASGKGNANQGLPSTQVKDDFKFNPVRLVPFFIVGYSTYSEYQAGTTD
jgi:hypothetical protein